MSVSRARHPSSHASHRTAEVRSPAARTPGAEALLTSMGPVMVPKDAPLDQVLHGNWVFEVKYNGERATAAVVEGEVALRGRGRKGLEHRADFRRQYPELVRALARLRREVVLDGEVVGQDERGATLLRHLDAHDERRIGDRRFVAFDVLWLDGHDLRKRPLSERRAVLEKLVTAAGDPHLALAERLAGPLSIALTRANQLELEGVVAKLDASPYRPGSSDAWRRLKPGWTQTMAILGYVTGTGDKLEKVVLGVRAGQGYSPALWLPVSRVSRDSLHAALAPDAHRKRSLTRGGTLFEVTPRHAARVRYAERGYGGELVKPTYIGRFPARQPEDTTLDQVERDAIPRPRTLADAPTRPGPELERGRLQAFPKAGVTREALLTYYRALWPTLSPLLRDRPLVLEYAPGARNPQLVDAKALPEGLTRHGGALLLTGPEGLVELLNDQVVGLGLSPQRAHNAEQPDWVTFALRSGGRAPKARLAKVALALRDRLANIHLRAFPKTSGDGGLDLVVPLRGPLLFDEARAFARQVVQVMEEDLPTSVGAGRERIGLTTDVSDGLAPSAPYLCRALPGAPISLPLEWSEVTRLGLYEAAGWKHAVARLASKGDPFAAVLTTSQTFPR